MLQGSHRNMDAKCHDFYMTFPSMIPWPQILRTGENNKYLDNKYMLYLDMFIYQWWRVVGVTTFQACIESKTTLYNPKGTLPSPNIEKNPTFPTISNL